MNKEIFDKIEALITNQELVDSYYGGTLEYWDSGNFDDCFEQGVQVGFVEGVNAVLELLSREIV